ncbi:hypothetical protein D3C80_1323680 [compost metagenome]
MLAQPDASRARCQTASPGASLQVPVLDCKSLYGGLWMLPECQLFGTLGCHLCDVAEAMLMPFVEHGLLVELIDIVERDDWVERYALRIPVLRRCDTGAELNWPFESEQVVAFLR